MTIVEEMQAEVRAAPGASAPLEVRPATAAEEGELDRFVCASAGSSIFQRPAWRRAVARTFGHRPADFVAHRGGELVGLLPLAHCGALLSRAHLVSVPYGVYGGPLARDPKVAAALVDAARALGERERVGRIELRCREPLDLPGLARSDLYITFRRELPEDPAGVLALTPKDERRLVRRARDKHGLEMSEGPWFAAELARLFHDSKRRLGSPGLPLAWFRNLLEEFGPAAVVHVVRRERELVAASLSFVHRDELAMYYIGTAPEANRAWSATSFLVVGLQEWAVARGLRVFDLGRSRKDAGAADFKRNQGFEPEPLHYAYALLGSSGPPTFTPSNPRTALLRRTWSRMPAWLATALSGPLARRLV